MNSPALVSPSITYKTSFLEAVQEFQSEQNGRAAHGGHIGYDIRPSARGHGYGTLIIKLGLAQAKAIGLTKALVTCDPTNLASKKIIEKNGEILEMVHPETHSCLYWIDLD